MKKNQKPKILFIGRFPPPVHGASIINDLYFNSKAVNEKFDLKKVKVNRYENIGEMGSMNFKKFFGTFNVFLELLKNLVFFNPDLIYFEVAPNGIAFYRDSSYVLLCKIFGKKIIFQIHARNLEKNTYSRFIFKDTKMIILSNLLMDEVKNLFNEKDVYILPNGIPDQLNDKYFEKIIKKRKNNKKPSLLFLSNMVEEKGVLDVLNICNELNKNGLDFECLFVGPWQDKNFEAKWRKKLKEYRLEKKCNYLGPKYGAEKKKILEQSHFMIFPTKYKNESFPLVILEAFMYGIPVLAYDNGAIKEIVSKDYLGKVVEMGGWQGLARELEKRINGKTEYRKIRKYFKKNYTIDVTAKKLIKIFYRELK